jgi:nicotinate-nucleotide adenylyltransferase
MVKSESKAGKKKKIAVLGGAFDPVHLGHLVLAEYALNEFSLDKVLLLPYNISAHKEPPQAAAKDRLNMLKLAIIDNPAIEVSDIEIKRGGLSYSYETLKYLKSIRPQDRLYFIIGSDAFSGLKSWKNYKSLINCARFIVAVRAGARVKRIKAVRYDKILIPNIDVSSSYIKERVKRGLSLRYLLPDKIRDYIINFRLYR